HEDDLLAGLDVERAIPLAEHHVGGRELLARGRVVEPEDLDRLLERAGASAPAIVATARLGARRRAPVGADVGALEVLLDADEADAKALRALAGAREIDVACELDRVEVDGPEALLVGHANVRNAERIEADDPAADRV